MTLVKNVRNRTCAGNQRMHASSRNRTRTLATKRSKWLRTRWGGLAQHSRPSQCRKLSAPHGAGGSNCSSSQMSDVSVPAPTMIARLVWRKRHPLEIGG